MIATRIGVRATLAVSHGVAASGAVLITALMSPGVSYAALIPGLILLSLGDGIVYTVMFIAASTGVAERDQGVASGIASTGTQVGNAVGLAVLVAVAGVGAGAVTTDGLRAGILGAAAGLALAVLVALTLERGREPRAEAAEAPGHV